MPDFETILTCVLIPVAYVVTYIAGKNDLLGLIAQLIQEKTESLTVNEPDQFIKHAYDIVDVRAEIYQNDEELLHLSKPCPDLLASDRLKRQLADELWKYVSVSACDDRRNCRTHYRANIKVVNTGGHNH